MASRLLRTFQNLNPQLLFSVRHKSTAKFNPFCLQNVPNRAGQVVVAAQKQGELMNSISFQKQGLLDPKGLQVMPIFELSRRYYEAQVDWKGLTGADSVVHLNENNLDYFLKSNESVLLMFYAPWCFHCKTAKPEFAKAAGMLSRENPRAKLAAVDCILCPQVSQMHSVSGFPTIKHFKWGKLQGEYAKRRTAAEFVQFMVQSS